MRQKRKGGYFIPPFLFKLAWKSNFSFGKFVISANIPRL
jgi:hypothetical protein